MILRRYLVREAFIAFAAVLATLMLVVVAARFANYLAAAAEGQIGRAFILELVALKCIDALTPLLPASVFAGLLLALGRFDRDHEIVAMLAGGLGRGALAGAMLCLGLGFAAAAGALSLVAAPWVSERYQSLKAHARDSADLSQIVAERFMHFGHTDPVFYVERLSGGNRSMEKVFMHTSQGGEDEVILAPNARYVSREDGRFVVLEAGRRYVGTPGRGDWSSTRFTRYTVRIRETQTRTSADRADTMSTARLWEAGTSDRVASAELQWRLSQPVLTLVLASIAVTLSGTSRGRFDRLLLGTACYLAYLGLVLGATGAIQSGDLPARIGVWPIHGGFATAAILLFLRSLRAPRTRRWPAEALEELTRSVLRTLRTRRRPAEALKELTRSVLRTLRIRRRPAEALDELTRSVLRTLRTRRRPAEALKELTRSVLRTLRIRRRPAEALDELTRSVLRTLRTRRRPAEALEELTRSVLRALRTRRRPAEALEELTRSVLRALRTRRRPAEALEELTRSVLRALRTRRRPRA